MHMLYTQRIFKHSEHIEYHKYEGDSRTFALVLFAFYFVCFLNVINDITLEDKDVYYYLPHIYIN